MCAVQVAYLACSQFLDNSSDLIILVVNTIQRDLKSDNHLIGVPAADLDDRVWTVRLCLLEGSPHWMQVSAEGTQPHRAVKGLTALNTDSAAGAVCCALSATCRLLSAELISAVLPTVTELLKHPKELVRKKAIMAVHRFEQLDPDHDGPLHNVDTYALIRDALRDKVLCLLLPGCNQAVCALCGSLPLGE